MRKKDSNKEEKRLREESDSSVPPWKRWGPYVSERAWGTVREDYSANGDAWNYFPFDSANSKTYRWGEDGIAGWCDRYQILVFSPVFWNGKDPILKERLFGLNSNEGNHGEDVKEYYYYLDGTPTHSYMKYLYKYPQEEFPYQKLKEENQKRSTADPEYELIDTGIFNENKYFDIFIEYAKASEEDVCIKIEAFNRSNAPADLHILPHLWFRNQWSWKEKPMPSPNIYEKSKQRAHACLIADEQEMASPSNLGFLYQLGKRYLYGPSHAKALFTDNESRIHKEDVHLFYKDGFHRHIVHKENTVNPAKKGTKACLHYLFKQVPPYKSATLYLRLVDCEKENPLKEIEEIISMRKQEANDFYEALYPAKATEEEKQIQRQALAGMLWSKQIYLFDVNLWLKGDNSAHPPPDSRWTIRNQHWEHLNSMRIMSMPDKWEYPWFAAWDHAFHCIALSMVDMEYAKEQLWLLHFDQFQHPNGQIPSYEWEFSDTNPPVQGWAVWKLYEREKEKTGEGDRDFLERCFHKLLMNFSWWVNKVDSSGNNVFEGGFLGMDNISVLDRSARLAGGIKLQQSDGTGWMAFFCLNLMRMALELAKKNSVYESLATKFFEHYVYIADALKKRGHRDYEMWSEKDGFFYDVLTYPDGRFEKFRVRSLVGIIPLYATEYIDEKELNAHPEFRRNFLWFLENRKHLTDQCIIPTHHKNEKSFVLTLMDEAHLKSVLRYIWNPNEFRSTYGLRSLSKIYLEAPFVFEDKKVSYEPAESVERIKGGNSNWRGPIWIPVNYLLIESLRKVAKGIGRDLKIAVEGEEEVTLENMADAFSRKIIALFTQDEYSGHRPILGPHFPFKTDPHWKDHIPFYEYFNPETGQGLGASHQTGWSALVAKIIEELY
ncbi:MAG TPA: glucosidase [Rhabdochlamydiaceae bacterium]|jgi:hypothetical protein